MPGVGDVYLVTAFGTWNGNRVMLTHHYKVLGFNPGTSDNDIRASILSAVRDGVGGGDVLETPYLACLPDSYTLNWWQVQKVYPERLAYDRASREVVGTNVEAANTMNLAGVITLRGEAANRASISNKHIGPIPDTNAVIGAGELQAAYRALLTTLANALVSTIIDIPLGFSAAPCTFHSGPVPGSNELKVGAAQLTARVMRRRTVGLGI